MVDRTRIPTSMYPSGYTPDTPDGEVTPVAMTKSGSGEPILKEMIQDYPCGDEPGCGFRSSPLNIYPLSRNSAVVLYVEKGCANFTWESDNEWATFDSATTSARYNILTSSADEGQNTVVTVTDSNGLEVTITVLYSGASICCEDVPTELAIQTPESEMYSWPGSLVLFIDGGCPPFTWTIDEGIGFSLEYEETNSRRNRLNGTEDATVPFVTVEDYCGNSASWTPDRLCYPIYGGQNQRALGSYSNSYGTDGCYISGNMCASVYSDGVLRTFTIDSEGAVGELLDSATFQAGGAYSPRILVVSGSIVAVAWGTGGNGRVATYSINTSTGEIGSVIDLEEFTGSKTEKLDFIYVREDEVFCIAYSLTSGSAYITGVGIDSAGNIGTDYEHSHLFTEQFHDDKLRSVSMAQGLYDQDVVVAYISYTSKAGVIESWDISTGGIGAAYVGEESFTDDNGLSVDVIPLSYNNNGYVLAWQKSGATDGGEIRVYSQDADNNLTLQDTETLSTYFAYPTMIGMYNDCYFVAYAYGTNFRFHTFLIDTNEDYLIRSVQYRNTSYQPYGSCIQAFRRANNVAAISLVYQYVSTKYIGAYTQTLECGGI